MENLPASLRVTMTREEKYHEWEKFLKAVGDEVELRKKYQRKPQRQGEERERKNDRRQWSTVFAGKESNCAFCNNPEHRHENCKKVTDIKRITFG